MSASPTRWAARIEYRGAAYNGWQRLSHNRSVQATLETALSRIADHPVEVMAAGRTDAGVDGLGQVVHFETHAVRKVSAWTLGANVHLPADVSLRWAQVVAADFHARHSALSRSYRYVFHNTRTRAASSAGLATFWHRPLDACAMHEAAKCLVGEQDFSALRDAECQSPTPMREVMAVRVWRVGEFVAIDIKANAFLHHMVRNIAGTLAEVGQGRRPIDWVAEVLASRQRRLAGMTAPADGLTFIGPEYPARYGLPAPPVAWFPAIIAP